MIKYAHLIEDAERQIEKWTLHSNIEQIKQLRRDIILFLCGFIVGGAVILLIVITNNT